MQAIHVNPAQQRFQHALMAMAAAALGLAIAFPLFVDVLPHIPTSGHSHVHLVACTAAIRGLPQS